MNMTFKSLEVASLDDKIHIHSTPQKKDRGDCVNYRTLTLISHVSKIVLNLTQNNINVTGRVRGQELLIL